jgi:hypothetical protein
VKRSEQIDVNAMKIVADLVQRIGLNRGMGVNRIGSSQRVNRRKRAEVVQSTIAPVKRLNDKCIGFFGSNARTERVNEKAIGIDIHSPEMSTQNRIGIWGLSYIANTSYQKV